MSEPKGRTPNRGAARSLAERVRAHCAAWPPMHYTVDAMVTLAYAIEQTATDRDPLEIAVFFDWATGRLLGRLEQEPGMPCETALFPAGIAGINEVSQTRYGKPFHRLTPARRVAVLNAIEDGAVQEGVFSRLPAKYFYRRFYTKIAHGMFAEKKEWIQIGMLRSADPGEP